VGGFAETVNQQVAWAKRQGLRPDADAYLSSVGENLFAPLSSLTEADFRGGAGNELEDRLDGAAKMRALYSSSALVCNVFDSWRNRHAAAIGHALGISSALTSVRIYRPGALRVRALVLHLAAAVSLARPCA
jgi:hypothetical protein